MDLPIPTIEEIRQENEKLLNQLRQEIPELIRKANRPSFLSTNDLKDMGISYAKQQHMRDSGSIAYIQDNKKVLYPIEAFEKWAEEHSVNIESL